MPLKLNFLGYYGFWYNFKRSGLWIESGHSSQITEGKAWQLALVFWGTIHCQTALVYFEYCASHFDVAKETKCQAVDAYSLLSSH